MKLQIDGFDIEIVSNAENLTLKVIDASGKELSNNTYQQTNSSEEEPEQVDIPAVEDTETSEEGVQEETPTTTDEEGEETEEVIEGLDLPDFETFKKLLKEGKYK